MAKILRSLNLHQAHSGVQLYLLDLPELNNLARKRPDILFLGCAAEAIIGSSPTDVILQDERSRSHI